MKLPPTKMTAVDRAGLGWTIRSGFGSVELEMPVDSHRKMLTR